MPVLLRLLILCSIAFSLCYALAAIRPLSKRSGSPISVELDLQKRYKYIIGSDESGSGCIAGPIVVASVCLLNTADENTLIQGVNDCKLVSLTDRERIYQHVIDHPETFRWKVAIIPSEEVDASNALNVTLEAFRGTIQSLANSLPRDETLLLPNKISIYSIVDGHRSPNYNNITSRPWIQGDSVVYTIALASLLARVTRDRIISQVHALYPNYGFDRHGGYSSKEHVLALHQYGPSPIHRTSCKPVKGRHQIELTRSTFLATIVATTLCTGLSTTLALDPVDAMTTDPKTGVALPDVGEIEAAVNIDWSAVDDPLQDVDLKTLFSRLDSSSDANFYKDPRFVEHVDEQAVQRMTHYISNDAIKNAESVLDLCTSWTSHIASKVSLQRVAGLGMNANELDANSMLTERTIQDLNENPQLPYQDAAFDVVLCQLSIDYLTQPHQVCREIARVLKPGAKVHILFSNRLFLQKAVAMWTGKDDIDHAFTVASYLHFCGAGLFRDIRAIDLSARKGKRIVGDPLYAVTATKA